MVYLLWFLTIESHHVRKYSTSKSLCSAQKGDGEKLGWHDEIFCTALTKLMLR